MQHQPTLYLASKSRQRREILRQIGVPFQPLGIDIPEIPAPGEDPRDYVRRLAAEKARAGCQLIQSGEYPLPADAVISADDGDETFVVMGADTLGVCDGCILEKPADEADAITMLARLSGCTHQVLSAVSLVSPLRQLTRLSVTEVTLRQLDEQECRDYWRTGEPRDKAGAYAIQGLGAVFVETISGSYSGVVGLPVEETVPLLREFQVGWWQDAEIAGRVMRDE